MTDELGAAATTWNDYIGTAAADDIEVRRDTPSLYELAGLDRDRWTVAAIDFEVRHATPQVVVYAVDRGQAGGRDLDDLVDESGHVPVKAFRLASSTEVENFIDQTFSRMAIRLVGRSFHGETLIVEPDTFR